MKVAIVHDYLIADGGAEKCLRCFMELYPEAPVYTLFYDRDAFSDLSDKDVRTSFLDRMPFLKRRYELFLPLYPAGMASLNLSGYDVVLSSSWAWSKAAKTGGDTCHICYCHTPMRFAYDMRDAHLRSYNPLVRLVAGGVIDLMKVWDQATVYRVDYFIANSECVRERIRIHYSRDSHVIPPPVDTKAFKPEKKEDGDYFLVVSRLVPYKRVDTAVRAFNSLRLPLKVAGGGPQYDRLNSMAGPNVEMLGNVTEEELVGLYQGCRALVFPQKEDWGITSLEAQACGRPVIAYAAGGALEHVIEGRTGHFFSEQTPEAIERAVMEFAAMEFDPDSIRWNALQYDKTVFTKKLGEFIAEKYEEFKGRKVIH